MIGGDQVELCTVPQHGRGAIGAHDVDVIAPPPTSEAYTPSIPSKRCLSKMTLPSVAFTADTMLPLRQRIMAPRGMITGAMAAYQFTQVAFQEETREGPEDTANTWIRDENVTRIDRALPAEGKHFVVELPPSTSVRIEAKMRRFANSPSYAFPWHRGKMPMS